MLYKDLCIPKPKNTVVSKGYVYLTVEKIYRSDKKHNQDRRVLIGKIKEGNMMYPNSAARTYFPEWFENEKPAELSDTLSIGDSLVIKTVMDKLQITELIDDIFGDHAFLMKDVISYMVLNESTTMQHFSAFSRRKPIYSDRVYSDSSISRLFQDIRMKDRELFMDAWNRLNTGKSVYISYDSTNMNTYSEGIEFAEFGHAKEMDDVEQVNLSYVIDQKDGTPLFYELYPGSINDNTQINYMLERAVEFGYKDVGVIIDRGYFSQKNIKQVRSKGYDLIMMVKTNQKKISDLFSEHRLRFSEKVEYYIDNHEVYGMSIEDRLFASDKEKAWIHLYYDSQRASDQRKLFLNSLSRSEKSLKKQIEKTKLNRREDLRSYDRLFDLKFDDNGYFISYERKNKDLQETLDKMGLFAIVTTKKMSAKEALDIYRDRDTVEKLFRALKSEMDYNRFRVHDDISLENKTFLTFIANIVRNEIYYSTKELKLKSTKDYTMPAIIRELGQIEVTRNLKENYVRRYSLTKKQKDILKCFELDENSVNSYVEIINEKWGKQ